MRNWRFLLVDQLFRGQWLINLEHAHAAGAQLELLLNSNQDIKTITQDVIEARGVYQFYAIQPGDFSATDHNPSYDKLPKGSIASFSISGNLLKYGTMCTYGTEEIAAQMLEAANHKNVAGAFLDLDSGGGAVNAIGPLEAAIKKFKSNGKPVLSYADACYSAMYWLAASTNCIVAQNDISAGFGSIGVMTTFADVKGYYEQKGYKLHTIYAPESTEKNAAYEAALEGNYDLIKTEELSPLAVRFQDHVKENRASKLDAKDDKILKGKTYPAKLAVANGLADSIASKDDAVQMLFDLITAQQFVNNNKQ